MNRNGKYILGGGLSGLIFSFYHPEYTLISTNLGGKLRNENLSSTILIHDTLETRKFLDDLNIQYSLQAHIVKYVVNGKINNNPDEEDIKNYIQKKLTKCSSLPKITNINFKNKRFSAEHKINKLSVNSIDLLEVLVKNKTDNWIENKVIQITEEDIIFDDRNRIGYKDLVSTIPAYLFWNIYEKPRYKPKQFTYYPITFVLSSTNPFPGDNEWDLLKFSDSDILYTRVNRQVKDKGQGFLYEFTGKIDQAEIIEKHKELKIIEIYHDACGVIVRQKNNISPINIRFLGRFSQWDPDIHIQDVIKESKTDFNLYNIFNYQRSFYNFFFDFSIEDPDEQQERTKNLILHLLEEANELLEAIDWKDDYKKTRDPDKDRILEEWIDLFKFWVGIGNIWGFSLADFWDEFWRKSKIVEERFQDKFFE